MALRSVLIFLTGVAMGFPATAKVINLTPGGALTLQKALDEARPGDTVRLAAGVWRVEQSVTMRHGGSAEAPLTIEGAGAGKTSIKGSRLLTGWTATPNKPGVWQVGDWTINSQQLFANGKPLQQIGIHNKWQEIGDIGGYHQKSMLPPVGKDLADVKPGSFFYDKDSKILYCMLEDQSDPNTAQMEASVLPGPVLETDGADGTVCYVNMRNLSMMHGNATALNVRTSLITLGASHWTVEDCSFTYGDFGGISVSGTDHVIRRCDVSWNGDSGLDMNGSDAAHGYHWYITRPPQHILIEDSNFSHNNYRKFYAAWHAGGMKLVPCCRAVTIRNNRVVGNQGPGIWFDGGLGDNLIENNFVAHNRSQGIFYEISGAAEGDPYGAMIRNNRVIDNSAQGIYISASNHAIIENNTCYGNAWNIVVHGMPRHVFDADRKLEGNRIVNNIVGSPAHGSKSTAVDIVLFTGENAGNNVVDGNFYAVSPGSKTHLLALTQKGYGDGIYDLQNPARRKAANDLGFAKNAVIGDPQWINPAKDDFRLQPGSPAAGKGWDGTDKAPAPATASSDAHPTPTANSPAAPITASDAPAVRRK